MSLLECADGCIRHRGVLVSAVAEIHGHGIDAADVDTGSQHLSNGGGAVLREAERCGGQGQPDGDVLTGGTTLRLKRGDCRGATFPGSGVLQVGSLDIEINGGHTVSVENGGVRGLQLRRICADRTQLAVVETAERHGDPAVLLLEPGDPAVEIERDGCLIHRIGSSPRRFTRLFRGGDDERQHDLFARRVFGALEFEGRGCRRVDVAGEPWLLGYRRLGVVPYAVAVGAADAETAEGNHGNRYA